MRIAIVAMLLAGCGDFPVIGPGNGDGAGDDGPCQGLECFQVMCDPGTDTTVTGVVKMPNAILPVYDALVYVPNGEVPPLPGPGSCRRCENEVPPIALVSTRTAPDGSFSLGNMPATTEVPLVIQIGQWRRQIVIPQVSRCMTAALDASTTRLPRNRTEGDLPQIAVSTGAADALECLVRKLGIDDSELGIKGGPGSVHLFAGTGAPGASSFDAAHGGAAFPAAPAALWDSPQSLSAYDVVVMSCEGMAVNHGPAAVAAMKAYVDAGGHVLGDHYHQSWLTDAPAPWPSIVSFITNMPLPAIAYDIDVTFPRGMAFAEWLVATGASSMLGKLQIMDGKDSIRGIDPNARRWVFIDPSPNGGTGAAILHLSFTAPFEAAPEQRCGRFMFSDVHVSNGDRSDPAMPYPSGGCVTAVTSTTPQEKALLYQLFELDRCVDASGT